MKPASVLTCKFVLIFFVCDVLVCLVLIDKLRYTHIAPYNGIEAKMCTHFHEIEKLIHSYL